MPFLLPRAVAAQNYPGPSRPDKYQTDQRKPAPDHQPGICQESRTLGPFHTIAEVETVADTERNYGFVTSALRQQGWEGSYFHPLEYFFDIYLFVPCHT
ncbi:MAG TPA: hypothetical protein VEK34_09420 [Methylocella sp.]|nr:hypothetical protein [Methylocella sp.]